MVFFVYPQGGIMGRSYLSAVSEYISFSIQCFFAYHPLFTICNPSVRPAPPTRRTVASAPLFKEVKTLNVKRERTYLVRTNRKGGGEILCQEVKN
jgi:hypothetical protein